MPLWRHPSLRTMVWQNGIYTTYMLSHKFQVSWRIGFWEDFSLYIPMKKFDIPPPLHCGPTLLMRIMLWTNLNQHTLRMLNTYYSFSSQIVFERRFLKIKKNINNSLLSPLKRECGPSSLHLIMHWAVFGLKWLSGSGEIENVKC